MNTTSEPKELQQSLSDHVAEKGREINAKYGPRIGWAELLRILEDRAVVRYPCEVRFSSDGLEAGEFAYPHALGERPEAGFVIRVHPVYMSRLQVVPSLVLYQLVVVNYGDFASPDDAEAFGAGAMGLDRDEYYRMICDLADELGNNQGECGCG